MKENNESKFSFGIQDNQDINQTKVNEDSTITPPPTKPTTTKNTGLIITLVIIGVLIVVAVILIPVFISKSDDKKSITFPNTGNSTNSPTTTPTTTPATTTPTIEQEETEENPEDNVLVGFPNFTEIGPPTLRHKTLVNGRNITFCAKNIINETTEINGGEYLSTFFGENIFLVTSGTLKLKGAKLNKTGAYEYTRRLQELELELHGPVTDSNYFGVNSVIAVIGDAKVELEDCEIYSDSYASAGVHVSETAEARVDTSSIYTVQESSKGLYSSYNGTINSEGTTITTEGDKSECIGTGINSGKITCTDMTLETSGYHSPLLYSTGNVSVSHSTGRAEQSSIIIAESIPEPDEIRVEVHSSSFVGSLAKDEYDLSDDDNNYGIFAYYSYEANPYDINNEEEARNHKKPVVFSLDNSSFSMDESSNSYNKTSMIGVLNCNSSINSNSSNFSYGSGQFLNLSHSDKYGEPSGNTQKYEAELNVCNSDGNLGTISASSNTSIKFNHDKTVNAENYNMEGEVSEANIVTYYYEYINSIKVEYQTYENIYYGTHSFNSKNFTSLNYDIENVIILVPYGATLTLKNLVITKTCEDTRRRMKETTIYSENYDVGTNSAIIVLGGGKAILDGVTINTNCPHSNAVSAVNGGKVEIRNSIINTENESSRGLHVAYDGQITAENVTITTKGKFSECIGDNRLGGRILASKMTLNTENSGSPLILAAGNVFISNSTGTAANSRIAFIINNGYVRLSNCQFNCAGIKDEVDISDSAIYITKKMTEESGKEGEFEAIDSNLTILESSPVYGTAPMYFVTNLTSTVTLDNAINSFGSGILLNTLGTKDWWDSNSRRIVNLIVKRRTISGQINGNEYLPVSFIIDSSVSEDDYTLGNNVTVIS